jgi:hypothetical protein
LITTTSNKFPIFPPKILTKCQKAFFFDRISCGIACFITSHLLGNTFIIVTLWLQVILFSASVRKWLLRFAWLFQFICTPLSVYFMYGISYRKEIAGWEKPSQFPVTYAVASAFFIATMVASMQSLRIAVQNPNIANSYSKQVSFSHKRSGSGHFIRKNVGYWPK